MPYIDWDKIEALGIAGLALKSKKAANVLSDKEVCKSESWFGSGWNFALLNDVDFEV